MPSFLSPKLIAGSLVALLLPLNMLRAEPVAVRYQEGTIHGYLAIRSEDGKLLASGDLFQTVHAGRLTARLMYKFKDGSVDEDTAEFTQRGQFRLLSDHHVQKGPAFKEPLDLKIDVATGQVTVRYQEKGEEKVATEHMDLSPHLANGLLLDILKNISPDAPETKLAFVAATPKPRLVHLSIKADGQETFLSARDSNKAVRFRVHVDLGGVAGVVAPLVGKEPPDSFVWISVSKVPAFVRSQVPLYVGGPIVRTELTSAVWPEEGKGGEAK